MALMGAQSPGGPMGDGQAHGRRTDSRVKRACWAIARAQESDELLVPDTPANRRKREATKAKGSVQVGRRTGAHTRGFAGATGTRFGPV